MSRRSAAPALALVASIGAACAYNTHFEDCTVHCDPDSAACPYGLSCGAEGFCRVPGTIGTCSTVLDDAGLDARAADAAQQFLSCEGLATTCGPSSNDSCCDTATPIPGGTYYRSYDVASDGMYSSMSFPATVSPFVLDKYEVTVGRFRKFVETGMGTQIAPPAAGACARELNGSANQGGWDPSWNAELTATVASFESALKCDATYQTWTDAAGSNEDLPINCVTWYEAFAFCAWDGGFLSTEAEWNFAAAGGAEQRAYPWSSPAGSLTSDCSYANYDLSGTNYCVPGSGAAVATMNTVGTESPKGDGKWGHSDLGGNACEWTLDWYGPYVVPCSDCANLASGAYRVIRGGNFSFSVQYMRTADRGLMDPNAVPSNRGRNVGIRCARLNQ